MTTRAEMIPRLDDPDAAVRRDAAAWLVMDAVPAAERPWALGTVERMPVDALVDVARAPDPVLAGTRLAPWLARTAAASPGPWRAGALALLGWVAMRGADVGPTVPTVIRLLDDEELRREAALVLAALAWKLPAPEEAALRLRAHLDDPDPHRAHAVARALTACALRAGDPDGLLALAHHPDPAVREGTADALEDAAVKQRSVEPAFPAIAAGLADSAGGVLWHAVRAVEALVRAGVDVDAILPAIATAAERADYPEDGWVFGFWQTTGDTSLDEHHPGSLLRVLADLHRLHRGRWAEIEAALTTPGTVSWAARAAIRAFVASTAPEADRSRAAALIS